jgi:hypothetical protein
LGLSLQRGQGRPFFKHQLRCVLVSLGRLLFPDTPTRMTLPAVELFVLAVLGQLQKELKALRDLHRQPNDAVPEFRHAFADALGNIIPGVLENLSELALLAAPPSSTALAHYRAAIAGPPFLQPLSWKRHLVPFLTSPALRAACPISYAYCRLSGRFCPWKLLSLVQPIIYDAEFNPEDFREAWQLAAAHALDGVLTPEAREAVAKTCGGLEGLGPKKLDAWPALIVLEALSVAHNEFVRTIQRYSGARVDPLQDSDLQPSDDVVHFDLTACNTFAIHSYRGQLQQNGIPQFDAASEAAILQSFHSIVPYVIIHAGLDELDVNRAVASESTLECFKRAFGRGEGISTEQRRALRVHVKDAGKTAGLQLLIERVVRQILASRKTPFKPDKQLTRYIDKTFRTDLPLIERTGKAALATARNAVGEDGFKLRQVASIYEFIGEVGEDLLSPPDGAVAQLVVEAFSQKGTIAITDIGQNSDSQTPKGVRALIAKILADRIDRTGPGDAGGNPAERIQANDAAEGFITAWERDAARRTVVLLSQSEREALAWLNKVATGAGGAEGQARLTVTDVVGYFPKQ